MDNQAELTQMVVYCTCKECLPAYRQSWYGWESNSQPIDHKFDVLTIRLQWQLHQYEYFFQYKLLVGGVA